MGIKRGPLQLHSHDVMTVTLALVRDFFRHHATWIVGEKLHSETARAAVDDVFRQVTAKFDDLEIPPMELFELDDIKQLEWAQALLRRLGIEDRKAAMNLFVSHASIVTGVNEEGTLVEDDGGEPANEGKLAHDE
jgi:hypothetical protein